MSDSESDEMDALISNVTSRTAPAKKAAPPAASVGQAQLDKAILGKRGGDGGVDLEAMLKGAKRRDQQREATEQEMVRLAEAKAEDEARELATATTAPAGEAEAAAAGAQEEPAAGGVASREVFVHAPQPLALRPFRATDATDPMLGMLANTDAPAALALVEAGWLEAHYAHRPCPVAVLRWLFALVCYHPRPAAVAGASRALSTLLLGGGAAAQPPAWVPTPAHFVHALSQLGADPAALGAEEAALGEHEGALPDETRPEAEAEHGDGDTSRGLSDARGTQRSRAAKAATATAKEAAAPREEAGGSGGPTASSLAAVRHNLLHLLELPASCAPLWQGGALSGDAPRRAAQWVWRLLLAPHAAPAFLSLQDALGRLLDAPTEDAWQSEWLPWAGEMVAEWEGADLPSEALLHLCQWLPQTLRGQRLQRRAAHAAMERMLARRQADWASAKEAEAEAEKQKTEAMEVEAEAEAEEAEEAEEVEEAGADKAAEGKAAAAEGPGGDQAGAVVEEEAEDGTPAALGRLVARLEARAWKAHMSSLHSLLLLLDLALSSDAAAHRGRASDLSALARRLRALKQRVAASKAGMDYHALEVESLLAFLPSKLTHLYGLE